MNIKVSCFWGMLFFLIIFFSVLSSPVFAAKSSSSLGSTLAQKRIKIGAKLREYKPPTKADCDIRVPKQYPTIQAGIDAALTGNTICVDKGTYNEDIVINKSIRLSGKGTLKTIINGQNPDASGTVYITAKNVIVEGFSINGVGNNRGTAAVRQFEQVYDTIIRYNRIVAGNGQLAFLTDNAQNNNLVANNILVGNNSPDIAKVNAFDSNKPTDKVDFLNNTFIGTVSPTDWQTEAFVLDAGAPNSLIQQNVFNATGTMVAVIASNNSSSIHENNFNGGTTIKVAGGWGPSDLNAENNWWGDSAPSDNVQGAIDFTPFATSPFTEN
ncbi:MAG: copper-binding protein [uncultured bacterium]|uniref:Nitrous oxidase accessory protein n=3 Tax=Candidatus Daviesiibacteriota TaxID=1752718 RepID=A0A0G0EKG5_9BACT|nr:MAG: copper-binding protein [uncultured bacterium]KKQ07543.1 MAG: Nitrous oxidase accessory protein [Candidatus Daviesbacteria bacterium GW2011_GWB1_36_5]OGE16757.1 MAG: hypothetical protein A2858_04000 [Candidatus Daviesbacteria bacterium RIFCSPHIGHO2_01_FULL_36_37]OGE35296.1 MAG: hypothetical protein A3E66_00355 [Candidatus Daviesbacteria bacterium RIFCSPHIGHO2_12_FULL_37_16]